jgi:PKD repeat protein
VDPASPELNELAELTAGTGVGSGPISTWAWNFGDGTTSTQQNPSHTWTAVGAYTVTLTATGPLGATGTASATVNVVPPPPPVIAGASASPSPALTGQSVSFIATIGASSGPINTWLWDFGNGTTSIQQNPFNTYPAAGVYTVTVTATGPVASDVETFSLTVNTPPPVLTTPGYTPSVVVVGAAVNFSVGPTGSSGPIASYLWDFNGVATSTVQNPSYTFGSAGTKTVTVEATGAGGSDIETIIVTVYNPISADFTASQPDGPGTAVVFNATATGPPVASWSWTFGDGGTSTAQNPSHTYAGPGVQNVTLTVTDGAGRPFVRNNPITVL